MNFSQIKTMCGAKVSRTRGVSLNWIVYSRQKDKRDEEARRLETNAPGNIQANECRQAAPTARRTRFGVLCTTFYPATSTHLLWVAESASKHRVRSNGAAVASSRRWNMLQYSEGKIPLHTSTTHGPTKIVYKHKYHAHPGRMRKNAHLFATLWCICLYRITQLRFHERHQSALTSAVERCRQELHIAGITVSTLHICFCGMALGDRLLHYVAVLSIAQIPSSISSAILVARMWIYT